MDAVVAEARSDERRQRSLPARVVVVYVLAMALFSDASYQEVMRQPVDGLSWASGWPRVWEVQSKAAIFKARWRLGPEPSELLFGAVCEPLAGKRWRGAFYRGLRLMSLDGTTLDVTDTAENVAVFGRRGSAPGLGVRAFPQLRVVGLAEYGTTRSPERRWAYNTSELVLANELLLTGVEVKRRPAVLITTASGMSRK